MNCVPIDMLPTPWAGEIRWSLLHFGTFIHCFFAAQRLHAQTSVTSYTSVNIYNFNSRLAHFNALWMEYIRSLRTGIMAEYPVMSTSQGSYVRIEQTSEAIRVTYEICRAGGGARGLELRTAALYTEALSCLNRKGSWPNCCYKIKSTQFPRISLYA